MEALKIEKNKYGLKVYCTSCLRYITPKTSGNCSHPDYQVYKSMVYVQGSKKAKVKTHKTRDFDEALSLSIQFKKEVKSGMFDNVNTRTEMLPHQLTILDAANNYLRFKNGIDVYEFEKRKLDKDYLGSIKLYVQQFVDVMRANGYNVETMPIATINGEHLNYWWKYVRERYNSPWSVNASLRCMRTWISHVIDYERVNMRNFFKDVKLQPVDTKVEAITKREFDEVCYQVNNGDKYKYLGGKTKEKKNRYKSYLIDAFKLGLFTGLRREELVSLKWNDIRYIEHSGQYMIVTDNLKVERITGNKYKPKYIPVHNELNILLMSLGWDSFKDSEHYILEPFRKVKYQTMMDAISKGFSHYYSQAYPNTPLRQFKCLRKTYLTYLNKSVGDKMIFLSSHGGKEVLEQHYLDPTIVAQGLTMKIFD